MQLHILLMKHQLESCCQSYTNLTSNLLRKYLFWNLDKELIFNASTTFARWGKKKKAMLCVNRILLFMEIKCQKQIWNSLMWPWWFFPNRLQKRNLHMDFKGIKPLYCRRKTQCYIFLSVFKAASFLHEVHW